MDFAKPFHAFSYLLNGNRNACVNRLQTVYNPVYFYPFNEKPLVSVFT